MRIALILDKEEFEPLLIELLSKAFKRQVSPEEVKKIQFDKFENTDSTVWKMIATLEGGYPVTEPQGIEVQDIYRI